MLHLNCGFKTKNLPLIKVTSLKAFITKLTSFCLFLLLFSCNKDELDATKSEIQSLLSDGQAQEALSLIESQGYGSIRDPEFASLAGEAYCTLGGASKHFTQQVFSEKLSEISSTSDFFQSALPTYSSQNYLYLEKCLSALYRSRHKYDGSPVKDFDQEQKENMAREAITRYLFFLMKVKYTTLFFEIFPYFYPTKPDDLAASYLVKQIEEIAEIHQDLVEQANFFPHPSLSQLVTLLDKKSLKLSIQGEAYEFSWKEDIRKPFYDQAKRIWAREKTEKRFKEDLSLLEKILQDIKQNRIENFTFPKSLLQEKLESLNREDQKELLAQAFRQAKKFIESGSLSSKALSLLIKELSLLAKKL